MRILVMGAGGTGGLLARLLARQGHTVWCGDRDVDRARHFLGKKSGIEIVEANARNVWSIARAARGAQLVVNTSPAVFNKIILRAALRLRAHYLDLNSHLTAHPFRPEQFAFNKRFAAKKRTALVCVGRSGRGASERFPHEREDYAAEKTGRRRRILTKPLLSNRRAAFDRMSGAPL